MNLTQIHSFPCVLPFLFWNIINIDTTWDPMTYVLILGIKKKKMEINFSEATWNLFLYLCSRVSSGSNEKICHSFRYILVRQWRVCLKPTRKLSGVIGYRTILCAEIQIKIESCSFHNHNESQWQNAVWYVSKNRLLLQHISFVPLVSWFLLEAGWGPQRYYSGETLLTPLGTNGWTNIFCWLKCWDDCMGLKLPLSLPNSFIPPVPLSTSCWSDSSLNLIHQPKRSFLNVLLHLREMIQLVFLLESKGEWDQNSQTWPNNWR